MNAKHQSEIRAIRETHAWALAMAAEAATHRCAYETAAEWLRKRAIVLKMGECTP